jgi:hypothetical protein
MARRLEVPRRVPVLGTVAATDVSAASTNSQMNPGIAEGQAFFAAAQLVREGGSHGGEMGAGHQGADPEKENKSTGRSSAEPLIKRLAVLPAATRLNRHEPGRRLQRLLQWHRPRA